MWIGREYLVQMLPLVDTVGEDFQRVRLGTFRSRFTDWHKMGDCFLCR